MSNGKPLKPKVSDQAKLLSAFVKAFGQTLLGGKKAQAHKALAAQLSEVPEGTSRLWAQNAKLILEDGIALLVEYLQAELEVLDPSRPLVPEKPEGYLFKIQTGRMAMDGTSISNLMNRYAFPAGKQGPLTNIQVTLPEGQIHMDATFHMNRFIALNLRMKAQVSVSPEGMIALVPIEIRAGSMPVDRLMGMLGMELGRFMPGDASPSLSFKGEQILINPVGMLPAPKASGRLRHVEITGDHMVMTYDNGAAPTTPPLMQPEATSYIAMLGHDLLVGKITMTDICLQMVPLDESDSWVELSIPHYRLQLAQGESSLMYADELLYKLPQVADLKSVPLPAPRRLPPSPPPGA